MSWARQSKARRDRVITHLVAGASADDANSRAFDAAVRVLSSAAPKGYPKRWGIQRVIVEGTSPFPLAMLARDGAFPASEDDAARMTHSHSWRGVAPPVLRVELRRIVSNSRCKPYEKRWLSFGWKVVWYGPLDEHSYFVASKESEAMRSTKRRAKSP